MRRDHRNSHHLATISYDARFWDAYLEIVEPASPDDPVRGRIAFSAADEGEAEPVRTTTIFIEESPQEVLIRARDFKTHQLVALLRSSMPPAEERSAAGERRAAESSRPAEERRPPTERASPTREGESR